MTVRAVELGAFDFLTNPEGSRGAANPTACAPACCRWVRAFERRGEANAAANLLAP